MWLEHILKGKKKRKENERIRKGPIFIDAIVTLCDLKIAHLASIRTSRVYII